MIYFFKCDDSIKIGYTGSDNPQTRLNGCQTGSSGKITILGVMAGHLTDEKLLHFKYKDYRQSGEWFQCNNDLLEYIADNTVDSDTYNKVMRHVSVPEPVKPDMSLYVIKSEADARCNRLGEGMEALYKTEVNLCNELKARIVSLGHQLETAKPAIIYAIENPDVIQSNL